MGELDTRTALFASCHDCKSAGKALECSPPTVVIKDVHGQQVTVVNEGVVYLPVLKLDEARTWESLGWVVPTTGCFHDQLAIKFAGPPTGGFPAYQIAFNPVELWKIIPTNKSELQSQHSKLTPARLAPATFM